MALAVVVFDDEPMVARSIGRLLTRAGMLVTVVTNALEAAATLERVRPDVVLTDFEMPNLDGIGVLKLAMEMVPGARRLLVSGRMGAVDPTRLATVQPVTCLDKPFDPGQLVALLQG